MTVVRVNSLVLSDEELETIEGLAALGYSPEKMAMYLEQDPFAFRRAMKEPNSLVSYHIERGQLMAQHEIGEKLLTNAKSGNIMAALQYDKMVTRNEVEEIKRRTIYHED